MIKIAKLLPKKLRRMPLHYLLLVRYAIIYDYRNLQYI